MANAMEIKTLGIIGGGQLAKMLAQAALSLGQKPLCLCSSPQDPAAIFSDPSYIVDIVSETSLMKLFESCDLLTFENEFIDCDRLEKLKLHYNTEVLPTPASVKILQDKLGQKTLLEKLAIPSAPHKKIDPSMALKNWPSLYQSLSLDFPNGLVLKWSRLGYDGKGTFIISPQKVYDEKRLSDFFLSALKKGVEVFAEEKIDFTRELAVIGCYSTSDEFKAYPLVVSEQKDGICFWTYGPALSLGIDQQIETLAHAYAQKIAKELKLYGSFGVEFFLTKDSELLVNELAPRVHNTGHYTQNASCTSQFENHLRAIMGLPLGETKVENQLFIMRNLIGEQVQLKKCDQNMHVHWYGKSELRKLRKMGHINYIKALNSSDNSNILSDIEKVKTKLNAVILPGM